MDAALVGFIVAAITALAAAAPKLVTATSNALKARDRARAPGLQREIRELRGELAQAVALCHFDPQHGGLFDLFSALFEAARLPAIGGVVCSDGRYVRTWRYEAVLGHRETAGLPWQDPRFVDPKDLANSKKAAAVGLAGGNQGERIWMLNAAGVRLRGRVWSTKVVYNGLHGYRVFVVLFNQA